jgi:hypothetical protein
MTERYVHAAQVLFPGAAKRSEDHLFGPGWETDENAEGGTK